MSKQSLAIKYRPKEWSDVCEQSAALSILQNQLETDEIQHAYLFTGPAGCGKTTCARIFANEINKHQGNPIEMDAASNNGVDDARDLINQAKTKSLDSEYKVFIVDECHMLSTGAWNALLKLIEEPPAKSIFIFCTTDPQKIPKTILSRVQRYDFQRISHEGIVNRLSLIFQSEFGCTLCDIEAVDYIAKIADGGMRDAITMLDKCLAYSTDLTMDNVLKALGSVDYDVMCDLTGAIIEKDRAGVIKIIEYVHRTGADMKQFIKSYTMFVLDINKYECLKDFKYLSVPVTLTSDFQYYITRYSEVNSLLGTLVKLNSDIKWSTTVKADVEATLLLECCKDDNKSGRIQAE